MSFFLFCALSQAFGQFDAEGDGVVDVENMLMALKNSNGANLQGELSHVIRQLQACTLTPGRKNRSVLEETIYRGLIMEL